MIQEVLLDSIFPSDKIDIPEVKPWSKSNSYLKIGYEMDIDDLLLDTIEDINVRDSINSCHDLITETDNIIDKIRIKYQTKNKL